MHTFSKPMPSSHQPYHQQTQRNLPTHPRIHTNRIQRRGYLILPPRPPPHLIRRRNQTSNHKVRHRSFHYSTTTTPRITPTTTPLTTHHRLTQLSPTHQPTPTQESKSRRVHRHERRPSPNMCQQRFVMKKERWPHDTFRHGPSRKKTSTTLWRHEQEPPPTSSTQEEYQPTHPST